MNITNHPKEGIFASISSPVTQRVLPDWEAAIDWLIKFSPNPADPFSLSIVNRVNHGVVVDLNPASGTMESTKESKKQVLISAGLYDLSW